MTQYYATQGWNRGGDLSHQETKNISTKSKSGQIVLFCLKIFALGLENHQIQTCLGKSTYFMNGMDVLAFAEIYDN